MRKQLFGLGWAESLSPTLPCNSHSICPAVTAPSPFSDLLKSCRGSLFSLPMFCLGNLMCFSCCLPSTAAPASSLANLACTDAFHSPRYLSLILSTLLFICWWTSCWLCNIGFQAFSTPHKWVHSNFAISCQLHDTFQDQLAYWFHPAKACLQDFSHLQTGLSANPTMTLLLLNINNLPANSWQKHRAEKSTDNTKNNIHTKR